MFDEEDGIVIGMNGETLTDEIGMVSREISIDEQVLCSR